eukprot:CAMPEP_0174723160 /NCGR_PEP_ID=MMETSP1094-20130205/40211_1 /TAXON_ID=156173 /ORGANISM="Chrysochromulina brevifilum, Strain UTEX LB 985" /LENGTH=85 /DNA_ID=CAMNT_0015924151 /DNA_START=74 /DNA_END=332 /DNA_ORIENTATION=+
MSQGMVIGACEALTSSPGSAESHSGSSEDGPELITAIDARTPRRCCFGERDVVVVTGIGLAHCGGGAWDLRLRSSSWSNTEDQME